MYQEKRIQKGNLKKRVTKKVTKNVKLQKGNNKREQKYMRISLKG